MERGETARRLAEAGVILILEGDEESVVTAARAAAEAGVYVVEVSVRENAAALARIAGVELDVVPGAGDVSTPKAAWDALEAGARFVAATPLTAEIAAVCEAADVLTVAVVDNAGSLREALPLKPGVVRARAGVEMGSFGGASVPGAMLELAGASQVEIESALQGGFRTVVLRERLLEAASPEELTRKLAGIAEALRAAR